MANKEELIKKGIAFVKDADIDGHEWTNNVKDIAEAMVDFHLKIIREEKSGNTKQVQINHTEEREKDLQELCKQVLTATPNRYYNPNGADETTCPFCFTKDYGNECTADISDLKHTPNCAYNIAKGLTTNITPCQKH